jgi:hypothetical protein
MLLTGRGIRGDYALASFVPDDALEEIPQTDPTAIILHRTDMLNRKWPFARCRSTTKFLLRGTGIDWPRGSIPLFCRDRQASAEDSHHVW